MIEEFGTHKHVTKHYRMGRSDNAQKLAELNVVYDEISIQLILLQNTVQLGYNVMKDTFCRYKRVLLLPRSMLLWLALRNWFVPQYIGRYIRGVA